MMVLRWCVISLLALVVGTVHAEDPLALRFPVGVDEVRVPVQRAGDLLVVEAMIDGGDPLRLLVDTGSELTLLKTQTAERLGLPTLPTRTKNAKGIGGEVGLLLHEAGSLWVGDVSFVFGCLPSVESGLPDWSDGILGIDFLGRAPFSLDFARAELVIHRPDTFVAPADFGDPSPLLRHRHQLLVRADCPGVGAGWLTLDTGEESFAVAGDGFTVESDSALRSLPWEPVPAEGVGGFALYRSTKVPVLRVLGRRFHEAEIGQRVGGDGESALENSRLGVEAFRHRLLVVDPIGLQAWLGAEDSAAVVVAAEPDAKGLTPLMQLLRLRRFDEALRRLDPSSDLTARDAEGATALHHAAAAGATRVVEALLDAGAGSDPRIPEVRPLMAAASGGHAETVALLLLRGADPNATTAEGDTALRRGTEIGSLLIVEALLAAGADPLSAMATLGSPPQRAIAQDNPATLAALLRAAGQRANAGSVMMMAGSHGSVLVLKFLLDDGLSPDEGNSIGQTALFGAAIKGHLPAIRLLLEAGADPNRADTNGHTPRDFALRNGRFEAARVLAAE